jgi:hypothetical protein
VLPKQIVAATPWLGQIWDDIRTLEGKPNLIVWGMKGIAFRQKELKRLLRFSHKQLRHNRGCWRRDANRAADQYPTAIETVAPRPVTSKMPRGVVPTDATWTASSNARSGTRRPPQAYHR